MNVFAHIPRHAVLIGASLRVLCVVDLLDERGVGCSHVEVVDVGDSRELGICTGGQVMRYLVKQET